MTSTRPSRPKFSGLAWENIAEVLRTCPARARLAILDCCFAGPAIEALGSDGEPGLADIAHVEGVYTLTATTRNRTAHVPPPDQQDTACTSFTGELRDLIRSGIPGKPPRLTFSDIYPALRQRLLAKGLPAPSQRGTDTAHQFPFTANAAARTGPNAHNARPEDADTGEAARKKKKKAWPVRPKKAKPARTTGQIQATRILTDALSVAQSITYDLPLAYLPLDEILSPARSDSRVLPAAAATRAAALAAVAEALAATHPRRAARLISDAERIAQSIIEDPFDVFWPGQRSKSSALAAVTEVP